MKSRALPEDFDMTQALHSPFGANVSQPLTNHFSTPIVSPAYHSAFADRGIVRPPIIMSGLRRPSEDESTMSPMSASSAFNTFYTPPGSMPTSESLSPVSPMGDRAAFNNNYFQQHPTSANGKSFTRSSSFSTNLHPNTPRLKISQDRRSDAVTSPLRTSVSYSTDFETTSPNVEDSVRAHAHSPAPPNRSYSIDIPSNVSRPHSLSCKFSTYGPRPPVPHMRLSPTTMQFSMEC